MIFHVWQTVSKYSIKKNQTLMNWYYNTDTRSYINNSEVYLDPYFIMITIAILNKFNFYHFNTNPVVDIAHKISSCRSEFSFNSTNSRAGRTVDPQAIYILLLTNNTVLKPRENLWISPELLS